MTISSSYTSPAAELQMAINSYTLRGFYSALLCLLLLGCIYYLIPKHEISTVIKNIANDHVTEITITEVDEDEINTEKNINKSEGNKNFIKSGIDEVSGDIKTVPDKIADVKKLLSFSSLENMEFTLNRQGEDEIKNRNSVNKTVSPVTNSETVNNNDINNDDISFVEQIPKFDLTELQKNLEYPELARRAGVEGKVIVKTIIGKRGEVLSTSIFQSDNETLDRAALEAIIKTEFKPAIQNGKSVDCIIYIPVVFRLRNSN